MHHIEGALSGLPIIYRESGAIPEYCYNFGLSFQNLEIVNAIESMILEYDNYRGKIKYYPYTASKMTSDYLNLFEDLILKRENILKKKNLFKSPFYLLMNLITGFLYIKKPIRNIKKLFKIL